MQIIEEQGWQSTSQGREYGGQELKALERREFWGAAIALGLLALAVLLHFLVPMWKAV